jgi:predicted ester cyclase
MKAAKTPSMSSSPQSVSRTGSVSRMSIFGDLRSQAVRSHPLRSAFPDLHIAVEDAMASGNKVTVRVMLEGTHQGDGLGVAPTGH